VAKCKNADERASVAIPVNDFGHARCPLRMPHRYPLSCAQLRHELKALTPQYNTIQNNILRTVIVQRQRDCAQFIVGGFFYSEHRALRAIGKIPD